MSEPFLGELKFISWNFAPKGWAFANGQLLPINQNQALFSILGTTYGGDGRVNFGLPNLQGRVPVHVGNGIVLGQVSGTPAVTLLTGQLPQHNHAMFGDGSAPPSGGNADTPGAGNTLLGQSGGLSGNPARPFTANMYATGGPNTILNPQVMGNTGGNQPHNNMSPYLVLNVIVALQGIFPSQN